ncbi:DUF2066 domain-containing protein [Oceanicoccus sp. KOV_DT_Chl]|uniref:DUF2066 domain-containing protein n=1 Tax=Oceanicoccus sp. KOV_DT_Chl TaxID=1904639 RepID=UPI0011AF0447|nr:DUF2066 domain-containing protein [Oceanicoccus sp. KOV_DT_Chl]
MFSSRHFFSFIPMIVATLCLCLTASIHAEPVAGLYDVAVPVDSQSSKALSKATVAGLKTVFIRVSGHTNTLEQPQIVAAIRRASSFTRQFRYEQRASPLVDGGEQLYAVIEFEQQLVDAELRQAGLPLWSSNRPTVLLWLVMDDSQGRRSVGVDRDAPTVAAITANARRRGLAIKLPTLDLEDMVAVSTDELWQLTNWRAQSAAERYGTDTVLFGRVSRLTSGELLGSWYFRYDQQQVSFDGDADNINDFIGAALDQVAELLGDQYAVAPVRISDNGLLLRMTGVSDFTAYARAIQYLESVAAIRHANVVAVEGDEIIVRIVADGLLSQLQQAFVLDGRLQQSLGSNYQGDYVLDLDYHWPASTVKTVSQ